MNKQIRGKKRIARSVAACVALSGAAPATASDDYGWFAGFNAGQAKLHDFRLPTTSSDDKDTVLSAFGGYQFTRYVAVAGGYVDLGKYNFQGPSFGGYTQQIKVDGFQLSAIGSYPVAERVDLAASAGVFRWNVKFHSSDPIDPNINLSDSGYSPTFGVGVNIDIFSKRGTYLYLGWQKFWNVGDRGTVEHENDYTMYVIGVTYNLSKIMEARR
jgi:hypothetical protein